MAYTSAWMYVYVCNVCITMIAVWLKLRINFLKEKLIDDSQQLAKIGETTLPSLPSNNTAPETVLSYLVQNEPLTTSP